MGLRLGLRILGGFSLVDGDGREVALPSRRAAALLATLAVDGRAARAKLAEHLWPGSDLAAARRNLRRELARLRDAGLASTFSADAGHIGLGPSVAVDLHDFIAACEADDPALALEQWRGGLLAGFTLMDGAEFEAWLQHHRGALVQRWRQAAARRAERLEHAGAWRDALRWHEALRNDDPLQEGHYVQAMRLHLRLGERAAALDLYAQCVRMLRDELGAQPQASTSALAARIRAAEDLQPIVARRAAPLPAPLLDVPLIGREADLAAVRNARSPLLLLVGDAGVGKTRLGQEALLARSTLGVRCEVGAGSAALYPVAEALRQALDAPLFLARLDDLPMATRREAARLVPELAVGDPASTAAVPKGRFFDALGDVIDRIVGPAGVLWVDDLHAADDATLELLAQLAYRYAADPTNHARLVCAARTPELDARSGVCALLRRLERARLVQRVELGSFSVEQTRALIRALSGNPTDTAFAAQLHRATQGNAFHLLETLRFLFDSGELRVDDDGAWRTRFDEATDGNAVLPVPATVAATVLERAERVGPAVRHILEAAALTRSGFTLAQIQGATPLGEWEALDALESALRLQLIAQTHDGPQAPGRLPGYRFVHELTREALAQSIRPERRRLIHERLAQALMARHEAADHIAWHLEEAGQPGAAVPWRLAAARESRRLFAWRGELAHLQLAWAATLDRGQRLEIVRDRLDAARRLYDFTAMAEALADLDGLAVASCDASLGVESLVWQAEVAQLQKRPFAAIEPLRQAIDGPVLAGLPALRLRAVVALANAWLVLGQIGAAQRLLSKVDARDPDLAADRRAALLTAQANAARMGNDPARAQALLREATLLLQGPDQVEARLQAQNLLAHTQYALGDTAGAITTLEAVLAEAEHAQPTVVLRTVLPNLSTLCTVDGQLERAEAFLDRGMQALRYVDNPATLAALQGRLAELRLTRGDLGRCITAARESIRQYESNGGRTQDYAPWVMLAQIHWYAGAYRQAAEVFRRLPHSPACAPGPAAQAIAALKTRVARLPGASPAAAARIAGELRAMRDAPDSAFPPAEADYWCAYAMHIAGLHAQADALLQALPEAELGLLLHPASALALRLSCQRHLGVQDNGLRERARQVLAKAPPLAALELASALGDIRQVATLRDRLSRSLEAEPALARSLRRRWPSDGAGAVP